MKKRMIVGLAMVVGILPVGALSASAAESCCNTGKCADKQVVQQFTQETAALSSALKAKEIELRELNGYDGFDRGRASDLEAEVKELRGKIRVIAEKHGMPACCLG